MAKNTTPLVIGISGGTGSGKTTVANAILERIGIDNISLEAFSVISNTFFTDLNLSYTGKV